MPHCDQVFLNSSSSPSQSYYSPSCVTVGIGKMDSISKSGHYVNSFEINFYNLMADFLTVHQNTSSWPIYFFHLDIMKGYKECWAYSTLLSVLNDVSFFFLSFDISHSYPRFRHIALFEYHSSFVYIKA